MTYISPSKVYAHLDRLAAWQHGEKPAPVTVEWDLSNRCSLGCQSCHFAHTHTKGPWAGRDRRLPMAFEDCGDLADTDLVLRALDEMEALGVRGVIWSGGGEPTLHPDWPQIITRAADVGLAQGMYTLGGHLTMRTAAKLAAVASWVVVSLDAPDAGTYAMEKGVAPDRFAAACDGVRWLAEGGHAVVGVSFLLHARNWFLAPEMLAAARDLGATYTTFRPTIETHADHAAVCSGDRFWLTPALPLLEQLAMEPDVECDPSRFAAYGNWTGRAYDRCHGIKLNATITPDGRVWVCPQRRGVRGSEVGDLRIESFAELWARHPGQWTDFAECRVMCRLHLVNETLAPLFAAHPHEAFV